MRVGVEERVAVITATLLVPLLPLLLTNRCVPVRSLVDWPPIVGARDAVVDLLPFLLSDVVDEDPTRVGLDVEAVGVPEPQCLDGLVLTCSVGDERVGIAAIGAVRVRTVVLVYPEHLAEDSVQRLGGRRPGIFADRHVELIVSAEVYGPAVVVGGRQGRKLEEDLLLLNLGHDVAVGVLSSRKARDAVMNGGIYRGVVDVDIVVVDGGEGRIKVRVKGDA